MKCEGWGGEGTQAMPVHHAFIVVCLWNLDDGLLASGIGSSMAAREHCKRI